MAMKKGLKARWVAALRSGNYKQGTGALRVDPDPERGVAKYCCLGVLCLVSPRVMSLRGKDKFLKGLGDLGPAGAYAGISMEEENELASMNDDGGNGFKRIASWIEKNL